MLGAMWRSVFCNVPRSAIGWFVALPCHTLLYFGNIAVFSVN